MPHSRLALSAGRRPGPREILGFGMVALLACAVTLSLWTVRSRLPVLERVESAALDLQMRARGPLAPDPLHPILLLGPDEESPGHFDAATDRRQLAAAINRLKSDGAAVIALDLLLPASSRIDPSGDTALARSMQAAGNVLIPFALPTNGAPGVDSAPTRDILDSAFGRVANGEAADAAAQRPVRLVAPQPDLATAADALGHAGESRGTGATARFDMPGLALDGRAYPSLALRIAANAAGQEWRGAEMRFGDAARIGGIQVPVDEASRQWINHYGPAGTFESRSLAELLDGAVPRAAVRGRIVLIGAWPPGSGDRFATPFDEALPELDRLATVVDNILSRRVLSRPAWAARAEVAAMAALPVLAIVLIATLPLRRALGALVALLGALVGALQWRFVSDNEFVFWAYPALALVLALLGTFALRAGATRARREAALAALRSSEERYALAASGANDGLWDWDIARDRVFFSERWRTLMGLSATAAAGMRAWTVPLPRAAAQGFDDALTQHLEGRSLQFHHVLAFRQGGQDRWLLARGVAIREAGRPVRMAGSLTDISEPQRLQQQLRFDAMHDRLTGLPNRSLFREQLIQMLSGNERRDVGMLVLGLDGFRAFNEAQGTQAGDMVLMELARRLRFRDGRPLTCARIGPDEFGVAFGTSARAPAVASPGLLAWARESLSAGFPVGQQVLSLTASIGWAHCAAGLQTADELMAAAEDALARAKARGPDQIHAFDPAEQRQEQGRRWMRENIDLALLAGDQFRLHYQPFVRLSDRALLGFEALIRWQHPERGLIMPGDFIPVAEASGQINAIGRWTLLEAAAQLRRWAPLGFTGEVAVNISGVQLAHDDELLADAEAALLALGPVPARQLKLEVTESIAMANPQRSAELLQQLARLGYKLSIDDFGTGYSSLAYLHRFPFDTLKVDRSFVMRLGAGREAQEIVRTIVGLALALDKQILAEGVEDESQAALLEQLGVQAAQGWLFARALPADQAQALIGAAPWRKPA
ncbi:EAL domain-containing protein [Xylophilus sp. GOD-11R]|uniref:EAL domain-containing protein n=1 Tax=Xylophilus sp. GOD-11R TaxID=3089814 RepID=UPI00298CA589|nr:EAL domain-containing protein [Xylophilus sp. GOD-11R]WPB55722.1 EAL domain-containing protein [Xylophilus sp. GOD-11R]